MEYAYPIEEYRRFSGERNMEDVSEKELKQLTKDGLYHEGNFIYQYGAIDKDQEDDKMLKTAYVKKQIMPIFLKNKKDIAWETLGFSIMQTIFYHIKEDIDPSLHRDLKAVRFKLLNHSSEALNEAWNEFTKHKGNKYTIRIYKDKDGKEKINLRQMENLYNMLCLMEVEDAYE